MSHTKSRIELAALRNAALEDLLLQTDDELRKEAAEEGLNLSALAQVMREAMHESAAAVLRERLQAAHDLSMQSKESSLKLPRPPIAAMKAMIQELFATDRSLGLAFREGKSQTEADWISLYDDLVSIGAIRPHDDRR